MRPQKSDTPSLGRIPAAGSLLLLLAAMCAAYVIPERPAFQTHASRTVSGAKAPSAQAIKARILGQLSLGRRHAVRSEFRALYASLLCLPESVLLAYAPDRALRVPPAQPLRLSSLRFLPHLFQRPPPSFA